jgi:hypothetical protein
MTVPALQLLAAVVPAMLSVPSTDSQEPAP